MIKAVFFDIDGTLLPFGNGIDRHVPEDTLDALDRLHRNGIAIVVSTGKRKDFALRPFEGLPFMPDALVMANGQICEVDNRIVRAHAMDPADVRAGLEYLRDQRIYTIIGELDCNISLAPKAECVGVARGISEFLPPYRLERLESHPAYTLVTGVPSSKPDVERALLSLMPHCQAERWNDEGMDLIAKGGGKGVGVRTVADALGMSREELAAFGDAQNDLSMFAEVGTSVAMGNASEACKAAATFVTDSCDEGGIAHALERLGLI